MSCGNKNIKIMHVWFPIKDVVREVYKRTSYMGKTRFSPDGQQRLSDIIELTQDDEEIFDSYIKNAMNVVFDRLQCFTQNISVEAYRFDETAVEITTLQDNTIKKGQLIKYNDKYYIAINPDGEDENNKADFMPLPNNFSENSVHFIIERPDWASEQVRYQIDNTTFEIIINHIIGSWLLEVFPSEAAVKLSLAEKELTTLTGQLNRHTKKLKLPIRRYGI